MLTTGMDNRARPGMACSECNDLVVAPKSSAYVSNYEIRHVWMAPAWQEIIWRTAQRSLAVMCPAC